MPTTTSTRGHWAELPLRFEANAGQWDQRVHFVAHRNGATLFLTDEGMTVGLRSGTSRKPGQTRERESRLHEEAETKTAFVTMKMVGAGPSAPVGEEELVTKSNFFLGRDPSTWRTNVANFERVRSTRWLPGVDVVWHGGPRGFEYDLVVGAGTDATAIAIDIEGASGLHVANDGSLEIATSAGSLIETPPRVMQGGRELRTRYRVIDASRVAFDIDGYDSTRALLVDPTLVYSTYLGGSSTEGDNYNCIAVDGSGNAYVTGYSPSPDFPTKNAYQSSDAGTTDGFVAKLSANGSALVYSTYLGGSGADFPYAIAIDSAGSAYVTGYTQSVDFPTAGAFQGSYGGGPSDAFVTKLAPTGAALSYSTYLGGAADEQGHALAVDSSGAAYVTGWTASLNFPTATPFQNSNAGATDAFVTKLTPSGSALAYSTFLGGSGYDGGEGIAVDSSGYAYLTGSTPSTDFPTASPIQSSNGGSSDVFVTKLTAAGTGLAYSTYLGGSSTDAAHAIGIDGSGNVYIAGSTQSTNFPTASPISSSNTGGVDAFVTKVNAAGSALVYSTYLGGSAFDAANGIAVDGSSSAYVTGYTSSTDFPIANAPQGANAGGTDVFVTKVDAAGSAWTYSTYLGGTGDDHGAGIAVGSGAAYLTGYTRSTDFPTANAYQASSAGGVYDDFVFELSDADPLTLKPSSVNLPPKGSQTFTASGGSGSGYVYSLQTNASGGSINSATGVYTAGPIGSVTDIVLLGDSANVTTTSKVNIGPGVSISPANPSAPPQGAITFSASGGSGTAFAWSITKNNSGGTVNGSTGNYTAGTTGSVADTVTVVDSLGNAASVNVSVGGGLAVNPATPTSPPKGTIAFTVQGGSGGGFVWSLSSNKSGGAIGPSSGTYTAGPTGGTTDTVMVIDSLSNSLAVNVTVTAGVSITPSAASVAPGANTTFSASGGSGQGYAWSLATNNSGGSIGSGGGYTAGTTAGVADTVQLVDSLGNSAVATVTVSNPPVADAGPDVDGAVADAGSGTDSSIAGDGGVASGSSGGCGCRATTSSTASGRALISLACALVLLRRRRPYRR
ncbi:MAG TPA: SBBP repeat-containing protein [Polyangiaceae bacterium]|nr:SBBP repeat-containing protein [Polyangiaceae bacterium]